MQPHLTAPPYPCPPLPPYNAVPTQALYTSDFKRGAGAEPLARLQLTYLRDGTCVLGLTMSHVIAGEATPCVVPWEGAFLVHASGRVSFFLSVLVSLGIPCSRGSMHPCGAPRDCQPGHC